jgi:hypothetical protein
MRRLVRCLLLFALGVTQPTFAAGILHIADGDCASLTSAAAARPGQEPALIVLARNGHYGYCPFAVTGNIEIDGAGASLGLMYSNTTPAINVASNARLKIRNLNFVSAGDPMSDLGPNGCGFFLQPINCAQFEYPLIANEGTLLLDSISASGLVYGSDSFVHNFGQLSLRNVTLANATSDVGAYLLISDGASSVVSIEHSTLALSGRSFALSASQISISNSVLVRLSQSFLACDAYQIPGQPPPNSPLKSLGGNITNDPSCRLDGTNDRLVADAHLLDFGTHGGVVGTLALDYDSPAIGNGLLANCEATDARGLARGQNACDSGAYEVGGGNGKLSATGMSGLYFNAANNGHYVSIQRLAGNLALVIWNTFDENGTPAWLYGVGTVSGGQIHVEQVAQNVGGILHAGGGVSGATPTLWGTFDVNLSDCYTASLSYNSVLPQFGSGSTTLQRLAFLDGVNCAR